MSQDGEVIPAQPFVDWIESRIQYYERTQDPWGLSTHDKSKQHTIYKVAAEMGWEGASGVRRLYRYRHSLKNTSIRARGNPRSVLDWIAFVENDIENHGGARSSLHARRESKKYVLKVDVKTSIFERAPVEDALHNAGVAFSVVYPEIAALEDSPLEPEQWCFQCQENVSPIQGECPWSPKHNLVPWTVRAAA